MAIDIRGQGDEMPRLSVDDSRSVMASRLQRVRRNGMKRRGSVEDLVRLEPIERLQFGGRSLSLLTKCLEVRIVSFR